jgi:hypothetical protein
MQCRTSRFDAVPGLLLFLMEQSIQMGQALRAIFLGGTAALFRSFLLHTLR